jgi:hypothetical protein
MLDGGCRVTVLDELGRPQVAEVKTGDLWYFPPGAAAFAAGRRSGWRRIFARLRQW